MKKSVSFLVPGVTLLLLIAATMAACSKSGSGKPKISLESITSLVQPQEPLDVKFKFTNGSKLSGGTYTVFRIRTNQIPPQNHPSGDTVTYSIPNFNNAQQGELDYTQPYQGYLHFDDDANDTLVFRFVMTTTANVSSDTLTTPIVVVLHP